MRWLQFKNRLVEGLDLLNHPLDEDCSVVAPHHGFIPFHLKLMRLPQQSYHPLRHLDTRI